MSYIQIHTSLPGPKSQEAMVRRSAAVTQSLAQVIPVSLKKAHGALVEDVDGNVFIDLIGGIGVHAVGHTPKTVVEAIQKQAEELIHMSSIVGTYEPYIALCEELNRSTPGQFAKKTLLANGGAEAVENAVKLARSYTGRAGVLVFEGGYHGRTNLTMAMTSKYGLFKKGFGPFASEVYRVPVPNLYRIPQGMSEAEYLDWSIQNLENALIAQVDGSALAAIVIEPVLGEGGFFPVPTVFLKKIREICDRVGAVMIADEIQAGSGRTGKLYAIEHSGVIPDLVISAKSLGAGMPISAVTGRAEIMDAPHIGGVGSTYGGNPLSCVAALEALKILKRPGFMDQATTIERMIRNIFGPLKQSVPVLGDVRGIGGMMALEFVKDPQTKEPWVEFVIEVVSRSFQKGVICMRAGLYSNCIRFLPPLDIPEDMLKEALEIVAENIKTVYKEWQTKSVSHV